MNKLIIYLILSFCIYFQSCGQSVSINPQQQSNARGLGYYEGVVLDSGRHFHAYGDSVEIQLNRIFTFTSCSLNSIKEVSLSSKAASRHFYYEIVIDGNQDSNCAVLKDNLDSTFMLEVSDTISQWVLYSYVSKSLLDSLYTSTGVPLEDYNLIPFDTLSFFNGSHSDSNVILAKSLLERESGVLKILDLETQTKTYFSRWYGVECKRHADSTCTQSMDTLFESKNDKDTVNIYEIEYCVESSLECVRGGADTTVIDTTLFLDFVDERKRYSTFYVQELNDCDSLDRFSVLNFQASNSVQPSLEDYISSLSDTIEVWQEIFHKDPVLENCGNSFYREVYHLDADSILKDTALLNRLFPEAN